MAADEGPSIRLNPPLPDMNWSDEDLRLYLVERTLAGGAKDVSPGTLPGSYWVRCWSCERESYLSADGEIPENVYNILVFGYCAQSDQCRGMQENNRIARERESNY